MNNNCNHLYGLKFYGQEFVYIDLDYLKTVYTWEFDFNLSIIDDRFDYCPYCGIKLESTLNELNNYLKEHRPDLIIQPKDDAILYIPSLNIPLFDMISGFFKKRIKKEKVSKK